MRRGVRKGASPQARQIVGHHPRDGHRRRGQTKAEVAHGSRDQEGRRGGTRKARPRSEHRRLRRTRQDAGARISGPLAERLRQGVSRSEDLRTLQPDSAPPPFALNWTHTAPEAETPSHTSYGGRGSVSYTHLRAHETKAISYAVF